MARVLAVANQKGGVAKTTTVASLGAALVARGKSVLVVDLDPQASLTFSLGYDPDRLDASVHEVLIGEANAEALTAAVQDRRDSTSGVSLDEEMTNLIRFQRAYQASARAMSTLDEAIDVLINRTGRVGL